MSLRGNDQSGKGRSGAPVTGRWLRLWLRLLVATAAVAGSVLALSGTEAAFRDAVLYRQAPHCPQHRDSRPGDRCVGRADGRVADKDMEQSCTSDSNGAQNCTTTYELLVKSPRHTGWREVSGSTFGAARRGSHAVLRTWRGGVVRLTVRGRTDSFPPPSAGWLTLRIMLGWALAGVALGAVLFKVPGGFVLGWLVLSPVLGLAVHAVLTWGPELRWLPVAVCGVGGLWLLAGVFSEVFLKRAPSAARS